MSNHKDIIEKTIYQIENGHLIEHAKIKIRHGAIIYLCTEFSTSGVRRIYQEHEFKCLYDFKIFHINRNIIEESEQKINYKIEIINYQIIINEQFPLYVYFTDKELIQIGLKEKQKLFRLKLNETQRWFIGLCVALFIGVGNWYFDFLPTREKLSNDKDTDTRQNQEQRKMYLQKVQEEAHQLAPTDSTNILKNDSLCLNLND